MHPDDDIQAWLVDLDGTLVDTLGDFVAALGQVAEQLGRTPPTRDWVRCAIGRGGERLLRDALRHWNLPDTDLEPARSLFQAAYADANGRHARAFDGLAQGLAALSSWPLACVTNKPQALAEDLLPVERLPDHMPAYTQGLMDLGATVCSVRSPRCDACPVATQCTANKSGRPEAFPVRTRKLTRRTESIWLLWAIRSDGSNWLVRRPEVGIWAGLYCLPAFPSLDSLEAAIYPQAADFLPSISHALTHKDLVLHPVRLAADSQEMEVGGAGLWVFPEKLTLLGLPAPIKKMLNSVRGSPGDFTDCAGHPVRDAASKSSRLV